jgi:F-type H+-transporting ATPase subunit b
VKRLIPTLAVAALLLGSAAAFAQEPTPADQPTAAEPAPGSAPHEPQPEATAGNKAAAHGQAPVHHGAPEHGEATGQGDRGEAHGHGGFSGKSFSLQLLNFGALLFILIWFGGRAMNKALRARHDQLKAEVEEAARQHAAAEQRLREQDARMANLEKELATLRASIKDEAQREQARILTGAEERAKRISEDTKFQLDQQVKEAELRLRQEAASTAMKVADEVLRRSVGAEDDRRLAQDFVTSAAAQGGRS